MSSADSACRRYTGPSDEQRHGATAIARDGHGVARSGARSTARPLSIAWHFSTADSTSRLTSAAECGDSACARGSRALDFDGADDRGLQRRLVLLEIQRDLLVADAAQQRPQEEPATRRREA